jgi:hypothetical protein
MKISRTISILPFIALLSSCATPAQMQAQRIRSNNEQVLVQLKICMQNDYQSPAYDPLRSHIPFNLNDATLEQMGDDSKATKKEIAALYATHPLVQACQKAAADGLAQTTSPIVPILMESWQKREALQVQLIKQKISWGEYIMRSKEVAAAAGKEMGAELQQMGNQLQQENMVELQQRQQALENLNQSIQNQQAINALNRPRSTNCTGFGNQVNCTTY